jgi:hypothetical protein
MLQGPYRPSSVPLALPIHIRKGLNRPFYGIGNLDSSIWILAGLVELSNSQILAKSSQLSAFEGVEAQAEHTLLGISTRGLEQPVSVRWAR